jgi:hypothetical protein
MTERRLVAAGRGLALAGAGTSLVVSICFMGEFVGGSLWGEAALCLLAMAPLPVAWWVGRRPARGAVGIGVLLGG